MEKRSLKRNNDVLETEEKPSRRRSHIDDSLMQDLVFYLQLCHNQHTYRESTLCKLAAMTWTSSEIKSFVEYGGITALCELFKSSNYDFVAPLLSSLDTIIQSCKSLLSKVLQQIIDADVVLLLRDFEKNRHTHISYPAIRICRHFKSVEIDIKKLQVPKVIVTPCLTAYHISNLLGKGSFGKVYKGHFTDTIKYEVCLKTYFS